ncbi:hypothetical protein PIIN_05577 [Serendipita indica DSM 11827]|uniref:C2H2-type domain-containing protein n=1 Tax=Serendipita indica (strain DSM 11827) TaxID=1109443 RepID=G4TJZ4_SERID|nr:hypothetical protein PIIN_05577 [Serendipita indica DSM 11827]
MSQLKRNEPNWGMQSSSHLYTSSPDNVRLPAMLSTGDIDPSVPPVSQVEANRYLLGYPFDFIGDSSLWPFCTPSEGGLTTSTVPPTSPESFWFGNSSFEDSASCVSLSQYNHLSNSPSQEEFVAQSTNNFSFPSSSVPIPATSGQVTDTWSAASYNGNASGLIPALEALLSPKSPEAAHPPDALQPLSLDSHGPKRGHCPCPKTSSCKWENLSTQDMMDLPLEQHRGRSPARANRSTCRIKVLSRYPPKNREEIAKIMEDPDSVSDIPPYLIIPSPASGVNGRGKRFKCICCRTESPYPFASRKKAEEHVMINLGIRPLKCTRCGHRTTRKDDMKTHYNTCKSVVQPPASIPPFHQTFGGANAS